MIDLSLAISIAAFLLSLVTIYFQWFRVRGAKIDVLNVNDIQRSVPRRYSGLPKNIQDNFPNYPDEHIGYALVKVVFGNSGDRAGVASIQNVKVTITNSPYQIIKASYYSYVLVPAYDIVDKEILLKNIPLGPNALEVEVELTIEHGGYKPRSGEYLRKGTIQKALKINLVPAPESPPPITTKASIGNYLTGGDAKP